MFALGFFAASWFGEAAGVGERAAQEELDLAVDAAQIVIGPATQGFKNRWVDTK